MIPNGHIRWSLNIAFCLSEFVAAKSFARLAVQRRKCRCVRGDLIWKTERFERL
jgi:hypothetical protein